MSRLHVTILAMMFVMIVAPGARAGTPVETAVTLIDTFDRDLTHLDRARDVLEEALRAGQDVDVMLTLARVYLLRGDFVARTREEKLAAYERGRDVAKQAIALAPRNEMAHLWLASNMGRWGETVGVLQALQLLRPVREALDRALELNPRLARGHMGLGSYLFEVPEFLGGDRVKAERHLRTTLEIDPHHNSARITLARLMIYGGRFAEAREQLQRVLDDRTPTDPAEWAIGHVPRARQLLAGIKGFR